MKTGSHWYIWKLTMAMPRYRKITLSLNNNDDQYDDENEDSVDYVDDPVHCADNLDVYDHCNHGNCDNIKLTLLS